MYVVKVFLESSFYHHVENRCGRFCHTFTDNHFHPSPLAANWPLIGTKLNCRRPLSIVRYLANCHAPEDKAEEGCMGKRFRNFLSFTSIRNMFS